MKTFENYKAHAVTNEIETVLKIIENYMDNSTKVVYHIDQLLESKNLPDYLYKTLISLRDTYSINIMNVERFMS
ncbi:hypothetical protein [Aquimarina mytili]|uniref:Uncharacterized protein n=1 Tax=Aquimarina mytili TaxID=874423 RepID=A0A937A257_9FLAO|nr:hypothetical protein [Aquimarina mytili]MBL0683029.1 hypothetical protein [Aquimarina mytili]